MPWQHSLRGKLAPSWDCCLCSSSTDASQITQKPGRLRQHIQLSPAVFHGSEPGTALLSQGRRQGVTGAGPHPKARQGKDLLSSSCSCWQNSVPQEVWEEGHGSLLAIG